MTDEEPIRAAAGLASGATPLVNSAGISTGTPLITASPEAVRLELETSFFGPLAVTRSPLPSLSILE